MITEQSCSPEFILFCCKCWRFVTGICGVRGSSFDLWLLRLTRLNEKLEEKGQGKHKSAFRPRKSVNLVGGKTDFSQILFLIFGAIAIPFYFG
jgi:hypothetical protein